MSNSNDVSMEEKHDEKVSKLNKKGKIPNQKQAPQKPREYFTVSYDKKGLPNVSTLVDRDPYNLDERYYELMRE